MDGAKLALAPSLSTVVRRVKGRIVYVLLIIFIFGALLQIDWKPHHRIVTIIRRFDYGEEPDRGLTLDRGTSKSPLTEETSF